MNKAFTAFIDILPVWLVAPSSWNNVFIHRKTGELWGEEILLHFHIAVRINSNCIASLVLKKECPMVPNADSAPYSPFLEMERFFVKCWRVSL